jgi:hypothetical protein
MLAAFGIAAAPDAGHRLHTGLGHGERGHAFRGCLWVHPHRPPHGHPGTHDEAFLIDRRPMSVTVVDQAWAEHGL